MNMMSKIIKSFKELSVIPAKLIKYGIQINCILIIIGVFLYLNNDYSSNYSFSLNELSKLIVSTSAFIFAEIIIGGLLLDYYTKKYSN